MHLTVHALPTPTLTPAFAPARATVPTAKIMGAALAAAFSAKKDDAPPDERSLEEKEEAVIEAIRAGLDAGIMKPRRAFSALGDFGKASGQLAQSWLTPQQIEACVAFWGGGYTIL